MDLVFWLPYETMEILWLFIHCKQMFSYGLKKNPGQYKMKYYFLSLYHNKT